jgi:hypothetical protein
LLAWAALHVSAAAAQTTSYSFAFAWPATSVYGEIIYLQAQVRPWCDGCGAPLPTGSINFTIDGVAAGSGILHDGDTHIFAEPVLPGTHDVVASYGGDANNAPSTSAAAQFVVFRASTSLWIGAFGNGAPGQPVTVNATLLVGQPGGGTPSGQVVITDSAGDGCTIDLPATSCSFVPSRSGTVMVSGSYSGSTTHAPSSATTVATVALVPRAIGGNVEGLSGSGLMLHLDAPGVSEDLAANAPASSFVFTSGVADGAYYRVGIASQPANPRQSCVVANDVGTVHGADVSDVTVHCATNAYAVGGIVNGLAGPGLILQVNGSGDIGVDADGGFSFAPIPDGSVYAVTVAAQPSTPQQQCSVTRGTGTLAGQAVSDVLVTCATLHTVGGAIGPLDGPLTLQLNGGETAQFAPGSPRLFAFESLLPPGTTYAVTVQAPPPGEWCQITNANGVMASADVTDVVVECQLVNTPPQVEISVDDATAFARYGGVQHYVVTLTNMGIGDQMGVAVTGNASAGLDAQHAQWQCQPAPPVVCGSGTGEFSTTADLPIGASARWTVDMPVASDVPDDTVTFEVGVAGATNASDVDTLVVFRDGFDPRQVLRSASSKWRSARRHRMRARRRIQRRAQSAAGRGCSGPAWPSPRGAR